MYIFSIIFIDLFYIFPGTSVLQFGLNITLNDLDDNEVHFITYLRVTIFPGLFSGERLFGDDISGLVDLVQWLLTRDKAVYLCVCTFGCFQKVEVSTPNFLLHSKLCLNFYIWRNVKVT